MSSLRLALLESLPPYQGREILVKKKQGVRDIINEVLDAHQAFAPDYDLIVDRFTGPNVCARLFNFVKDNVRYEVEGEDLQTTMSPAAILAIGKGDCKHYSSFIGGVLDALNRAGFGPYDWSYRFAGYNGNGIEHVFVVVDDDELGEVWIDPAPIPGIGGYSYRSFNDRMSEPSSFYDRKPNNMALKRLSGISSAGGISTITIARRDEINAPADTGCNCGSIGQQSETGLYDYKQGLDYFETTGDIQVVPDPVYNPPSIQTAINEGTIPAPTAGQFTAIDTILNDFINRSKGFITKGAAAYLVNGVPLVFPAASYGKIPPPQNMQVVYPETYLGRSVPAGMPRPMTVGNRIILLPKRDWALLKGDNFFWLGFLTSVMAPIIASYCQKPTGNEGMLKVPRHGNAGSNDSNLSHYILFDMDRSDVVDYVTIMPTKIPVTADIPEGVSYIMPGGGELPFSDDRTKMKGSVPIEWFRDNAPPELPPFEVVYPGHYLGQQLPAGLPRPVYVQGKVQMLPKGLDWNILKENNFFWLTFLTSVFAPIIDTYSRYPYSDDDNKLAEMILYDNDLKDVVSNYLDAPVSKTWVGGIIDDIEEIAQDVATFVLKFVGIIPRTAFLFLVRFNVKGMANALKEKLDDLAERGKLIDTWKKLGGTQGDLVDAVEDGDKKKMIGGQVGQTGAEIAAAIASAAPVIAILADWLKKKNPELAGIVDAALGQVNDLLEEAGYDPIKVGAAINKPVTVIDPVTGKPYTLNPPPAKTGGGIFDQVKTFAKANPVQTALIGTAVVWGIYELTRSKRKKKPA